jgi:hypothetical protein
MHLWLIQVIQDDLSIPHYHILSVLDIIRSYCTVSYCIASRRVANPLVELGQGVLDLASHPGACSRRRAKVAKVKLLHWAMVDTGKSGADHRLRPTFH